MYVYIYIYIYVCVCVPRDGICGRRWLVTRIPRRGKEIRINVEAADRLGVNVMRQIADRHTNIDRIK